MAMRLVALDEGPDIPVDRAVVVVGRHPQCDARIDSIRVSRRHCCMTADGGEVVVRDLGSTNGIRINGQRVEMGRLRPGDELSIAHMRYRLENAADSDATEFETAVPEPKRAARRAARVVTEPTPPDPHPAEDRLAAAVRELLPAGLAERCRIQIIVQMEPETDPPSESLDACRHDPST